MENKDNTIVRNVQVNINYSWVYDELTDRWHLVPDKGWREIEEEIVNAKHSVVQ